MPPGNPLPRYKVHLKKDDSPTDNPDMKRAFITGIAGQDGSYLAELLLAEGYEVHGLVASDRSSLSRIAHIHDSIKLHFGDVVNTMHMADILRHLHPDEIYNLAAKSFVPASWADPIITADTTAMGAASMLEALRSASPHSKFVQATSSEIFGDAPQSPQNESTGFNPRTPYGASKLYAYFMTKNYRQRYGIHCVSAIMYNHESPRRPAEFVTRKITGAVAEIKLGLRKNLTLGNLDTRRDWGYAPDYARALTLMARHDKAQDFVLATGVTRTVQELAAFAFEAAGLDWKDHVVVDPKLCRPPESTILCGDPSSARALLRWQPTKTFQEVITEMVAHDLALAERRIAQSDAPARAAA